MAESTLDEARTTAVQALLHPVREGTCRLPGGLRQGEKLIHGKRCSAKHFGWLGVPPKWRMRGVQGLGLAAMVITLPHIMPTDVPYKGAYQHCFRLSPF